MSIPIEDFEDALVSACAKKAEADYIISRDDKLLQSKSPVKVIAPKDYLKGTSRNQNKH
ncbi:MAG: PIN domain-containing protein [Firmicutes bacterium]|nr:PIN domain-containing protein [Bacillota bacterium]